MVFHQVVLPSQNIVSWGTAPSTRFAHWYARSLHLMQKYRPASSENSEGSVARSPVTTLGKNVASLLEPELDRTTPVLRVLYSPVEYLLVRLGLGNGHFFGREGAEKGPVDWEP